MKEKKINNINEIKEEILDYEIIEDKIVVITDNYNYYINYSYENEEQIFKIYQLHYNQILEELNKKIERINYDKKLFKIALIIITIMGLLIAIISGLSFGLLFCIPNIVIIAQFINVLRQLKNEKKEVNIKSNNISNNINNKEKQLIKNQKSKLDLMTIEELFSLALDEILKENYQYSIKEFEENYVDYEFLEKFDFEDLDEEYLDEIINSFSKEAEKENGKQIIKTRIWNIFLLNIL